MIAISFKNRSPLIFGKRSLIDETVSHVYKHGNMHGRWTETTGILRNIVRYFVLKSTLTQVNRRAEDSANAPIFHITITFYLRKQWSWRIFESLSFLKEKLYGTDQFTRKTGKGISLFTPDLPALDGARRWETFLWKGDPLTLKQMAV